MIMKISKVKAVDFLQSFEYNNETYYSHRYTMEDGTEIIANHKKMNPISVGAEVEYEVKGNDKLGNPKGNVKEVKQNNFNGGGNKSNFDPDLSLLQTCGYLIKDMYCQTDDAKKGILDESELAKAAGRLAKAFKKELKELKTI